MTPLIPFHPVSPLFGRAATAGDEQDEGHVQPAAQVPAAVLAERAENMFSGKSGAVVASGDGAVTSAPSHQLILDVIDVVEGLPPELFDVGAA